MRQIVVREEETEVGLGPRLLAAWWFALAAAIPASLAYLLIFRLTGSHIKSGVWFSLEMPVVLAAALAFALGAPLVRGLRVGMLKAALRGILIASMTYLVLVISWVMAHAISSGSNAADALVAMVTVGSFGALLFGWPIVISGAIAGMTLAFFTHRPVFVSRVLLPSLTDRSTIHWCYFLVILIVITNALIPAFLGFGLEF
jgi:hypothetical protein